MLAVALLGQPRSLDDLRLRVNIPEPVAKALDLKAGDKVAISLNDHPMILEKVKKGKA